MFQIGPREIGADLAFGVDLALFILQCAILGCKIINLSLFLGQALLVARLQYRAQVKYSRLVSLVTF